VVASDMLSLSIPSVFSLDHSERGAISRISIQMTWYKQTIKNRRERFFARAIPGASPGFDAQRRKWHAKKQIRFACLFVLPDTGVAARHLIGCLLFALETGHGFQRQLDPPRCRHDLGESVCTGHCRVREIQGNAIACAQGNYAITVHHQFIKISTSLKYGMNIA